MRHRVSAAILAGGPGGADKAALLIGGVRIIDHQIAELVAIADDLAIIANDPTRYAGLQIPVQPDAMPDAVEAVMPRCVRGLEPLRALYTREGMTAVAARIARGALAVAHLARDVRVREVSAEALAAYDPHGRLFVNVNTPHDYARAGNAVMSEPLQDRITEEQ